MDPGVLVYGSWSTRITNGRTTDHLGVALHGLRVPFKSRQGHVAS